MHTTTWTLLNGGRELVDSHVGKAAIVWSLGGGEHKHLLHEGVTVVSSCPKKIDACMVSYSALIHDTFFM